MQTAERLVPLANSWARQTKGQVILGLQWMGLWPLPEDTYSELEGSIEGILPRVKPPSDFRQSLAHDLALVAQQKEAGLIVEYPHPYRPGLIIGLSAGVLATVVAIAVLTLRQIADGSD